MATPAPSHLSSLATEASSWPCVLGLCHGGRSSFQTDECKFTPRASAILLYVLFTAGLVASSPNAAWLFSVLLSLLHRTWFQKLWGLSRCLCIVSLATGRCSPFHVKALPYCRSWSSREAALFAEKPGIQMKWNLKTDFPGGYDWDLSWSTWPWLVLFEHYWQSQCGSDRLQTNRWGHAPLITLHLYLCVSLCLYYQPQLSGLYKLLIRLILAL